MGRIIGFLFALLIPLSSVWPAKVDKGSLCQLQPNGLPIPGPQVVLVYDITEPYPEAVLRNLATRLTLEIGSVKPGTRLTLFIFDRAKAFHTSIPLDSFCLAGHYKGLDLITAPNKNLLKKRRLAEIERLETFLQENNPRVATLGSPIIDALFSAVTSQNINTVATEIKIFLVSDLLEYSPYANFYKEKLTVNRAKDRAERIAENVRNSVPELSKILSKVSDITFLYVKREKDKSIQNELLVYFWTELLSSLQVKNRSFESIQ